MGAPRRQTQIDSFSRAAASTRRRGVLMGLRSRLSKLGENEFLFDAAIVCVGVLSCLMLAIVLFLG